MAKKKEKCVFCQNCRYERGKNGSVSVRDAGVNTLVDRKDRQRCDERRYTGSKKLFASLSEKRK